MFTAEVKYICPICKHFLQTTVYENVSKTAVENRKVKEKYV